jgi:anaerobic selenocysteine-containing dehydrogenase
MSAVEHVQERIPGYCALCVSRCGSIAVIEDGRFVALEPNPSHPTGKALCAKGRAAPELVYHKDRLLYPLKRTRPKGDPDPGWERIAWDEALDQTAAKLKQFAEENGPESVVFTFASPSTSASADSTMWIERLARAYGSPNQSVSMELCGWGRYLATSYTYGASVPGNYMPDLENAGCILYWGYNPNLARLAHGVATAEAIKRGARLIVVDPRRVGPANRADVWLRVRPGTDAALALGLSHIMIERDWYDADFVRTWTNGPLLVRSDTGRLLTERDLNAQGSEHVFWAWNEAAGSTARYDASQVHFDAGTEKLSLFGEYTVGTVNGPVTCRPAFDLVAESCRPYAPERVQEICGVEPGQVERAAEMIWEHRPLAY